MQLEDVWEINVPSSQCGKGSLARQWQVAGGVGLTHSPSRTVRRRGCAHGAMAYFFIVRCLRSGQRPHERICSSAV